VVFGAGARRQLRAELDLIGATRVLAVVGPTLDHLADDVLDPLDGHVVGRFTEVAEHVPVDVAELARSTAARLEADAVVSIGGGSSTGTAKAIALTTGLPVLAVPTTYAGSEITPVWGLTTNGKKTTGTDPRVLPRVVIYDPDLTAGLPARFAAASALNAVAHCVDSLWASRRSPVSDLFAGAGLTTLARGLRALHVAKETTVVSRHDLLYGAYLAGTAFASAGSGLHHKICHVLGGAFDLPHAMTHAIVLPHVLEFNAASAPVALTIVADALDTNDAVSGLRMLIAGAGVTGGLAELGMPRDRIAEVADRIVDIAPPDNPTPVTSDAIRSLLQAAWAG
jgi:alcohol dehydrogenase class IV